MKKKYKEIILNKDSRELSKHIAADSVDFIVTSPPYWHLRDYGYKEQIGFKESYEKYIENMTLVLSECFKVLKSGRFAAINIGTVVSNEGMKFIAGDFINEFQKVGFTFRKDIIWHKPKGTTKWQRGATQFTQNPFPLMYNTNINHEFILIFQKGDRMEEPSALTDKRYNKKFTRKMAYSVWSIIPINSPKLDEKHVAPYPEEIPKRLIQLYSFENDVILDPFAGAGTTAKVAKSLGRSNVSVEMSEKYCALIKDKLNSTEFNSDNEDIYSEVSDIEVAKENLDVSKKEYEKRLKAYQKLLRETGKIQTKLFLDEN